MGSLSTRVRTKFFESIVARNEFSTGARVAFFEEFFYEMDSA